MSLKGISKKFVTGNLVLDDISLDLERGEFVSILGPSGCGKSTLLKTVAGLLPPTSGNFSVLGVENKPPLNLLTYVFQDATLLPWLTVRRNVEMPLKLEKVAKTERRMRIEQALELVGLSHVKEFYPRQLSGGMKMRVSIARALVLKPQLMLMDEPFGALDEMTRNKLNEEVIRLRQGSQWSAIFVTHSVQEATFLSDRILIMSANPGRIYKEIKVSFQSPRNAELREQPEFHEKSSEVLHTLRKALS